MNSVGMTTSNMVHTKASQEIHIIEKIGEENLCERDRKILGVVLRNDK